jgi:hypothetical protein
MSNNTTLGYKKVFGIIMPDWVTEKMIRTAVGCGLSVVVMVFVLILVISPKKEDIAMMESELKVQMSNLESLRKSQSGIERMSNDLSEKVRT